MTIGEQLRTVRTARGMLQREFGDMVGLSRSSIVQYERSYHVPSEEWLCKFANALGIDRRFLITGAPESLEDVIRLFFWLEATMPDNFFPVTLPENSTADGVEIGSRTGVYFTGDTYFHSLMQEWLKKRQAWKNGEITDAEYFIWKMEYDFTDNLTEE